MPVIVGVASLLVVLAFAGIFFFLNRSKGIEITEKNFPDETFRAWVSENADGDGRITEVEAQKVVVIQAEKVTDAKGIEYFINAQENNLPSSEFTTFDLRKTSSPTLRTSTSRASAGSPTSTLPRHQTSRKKTSRTRLLRVVKLIDPERVKLINLPDGARVDHHDSSGNDLAAGVPEPETPTTIT